MANDSDNKVMESIKAYRASNVTSNHTTHKPAMLKKRGLFETVAKDMIKQKVETSIGNFKESIANIMNSGLEDVKSSLTHRERERGKRAQHISRYQYIF